MKSQDNVLKSKYDGISDEELIIRHREGESEIIDFILDKYKPLVRKQASSMYILGGDSEDLNQEGMIGLFKAIRDYDSGRDASFYTFAELCISRQMYSAVTASGRKKHMPLNTSVSLNAGADDGDSEGNKALEEMLPSSHSNPESIVIDRENVKAIEDFIENELSDFERQAVDLYLTGMNYSQIAKVLGKDEKSTDNALSRAKSKIKKKLSL